MGYIQVTCKNFRGWHCDPTAVEVLEHAGFGGAVIHTRAGMHVNRNGREVHETAAEAVAASLPRPRNRAFIPPTAPRRTGDGSNYPPIA
jgi:hypothetical protein